eukprot:361118-Chlamydomonas_euryale.AAC.1
MRGGGRFQHAEGTAGGRERGGEGGISSVSGTGAFSSARSRGRKMGRQLLPMGGGGRGWGVKCFQ